MPVRRLPVGASTTKAVLSVNVPSEENMTCLLSSHFHFDGMSLNVCADIGVIARIAAMIAIVRFIM